MRTPPALLLLLLLFFSVAAHALPVTITTTSLPNGNATVAYTATIATTGGTVPFKWAVSSGSLPPGLGLVPSGDTRSAVVSRIPSLAGNYSFSVTVTGRWGHKSTVAYSVTISPQAAGLTLTVTMAGTAADRPPAAQSESPARPHAVQRLKVARWSRSPRPRTPDRTSWAGVGHAQEPEHARSQ